MKLWQVILFSIAAFVAFVLIGLARVLYVLRPELLVLLYTIALIGAVVITCILVRLPHGGVATKSLVAGLLLGFVSDIASEALSAGNEIFDSRRAAIEKGFMEFQAGDCKTIRVELPNGVVHVVNFSASQQPDSQAFVVSGTPRHEMWRLVSEASYQNAERISGRHGLRWLFDRLKEGVYVWDLRPASCIRQP